MSTTAARDTAPPGSDEVAEHARRYRAWLALRFAPRDPTAGSPRRSVFLDRTTEEERAVVEEVRAFRALQYDAGFAAVSWPRAWGGEDLDVAVERAFDQVEQEFRMPPHHELLDITTALVAPTVLGFGTADQHERFLRPLLRGDELCCQLFSEPGAGSDLAGIATGARRDGDRWTVDGQKVWTSGAGFAEWGFLIARTDRAAPKHRGLTAFMISMSQPGVTVRPIRQMTGGSSFNEVFLDGATVEDMHRIGEVGDGWKVALGLLGLERTVSGASQAIGAPADDLVDLARRCGAADDPAAEQRVGEALARTRAAVLLARRHSEREAAGTINPFEGSVGKLAWSQNLSLIGAVATELLGTRICADTGAEDTWAWSQHLLGAPGYRIAGGSDDIQRSIIGDRVLGLPRDSA